MPSAPTAPVSIDAEEDVGPDAVDVRQLLHTLSVEELAEAADDYYRKNLENVDYFFAKPLTSIDETPDFTISFAQVLAGVRPLPGMRVLDFGAGTGWTSRTLVQLGCDVTVCDVSATVLDVARELFERQPVAGAKPTPHFLQFDGHRIDLDDESIDRILCIDAFHHVPNPAHVLREMGRVLKPGGVAGFQEPGPNHSKTAQAQYEMRNFTVVENDIVMRDIEGWAKEAGFTDLELAVFTTESFRLPIDGYEDFLAHGETVDRWYEHACRFVANRRIFFLSKGPKAAADSREQSWLTAALHVDVDDPAPAPGGTVRGRAVADNNGQALWLPSDAPVGPVRLGVHLYDDAGRLINLDYARVPLPADAARCRAGRIGGAALRVPGTGGGPLRVGVRPRGRRRVLVRDERFAHEPSPHPHRFLIRPDELEVASTSARRSDAFAR